MCLRELYNSSHESAMMMGLVGDFMILKEILHRSPRKISIGFVIEMIGLYETS
jgi:hypothetical protein